MGKGFKHGASGGDPLNFKVVGGTTKPSNPKENTIWVDTDADITSWMFVNIINPVFTSKEGTVLFNYEAAKTSNGDTIFDTVKNKNESIFIKPVSAFQYISGAWVKKNVMIYRNSKWHDWVFYLFHNGVLHSSITGWTKGNQAAVVTEGSVTVSSDHIKFTAGIRSEGLGTTAHVPIPAIDMTPYKTVTFDVQFAAHVSDAGAGKAQRGNGVGITPQGGGYGGMVVKKVAASATRQKYVLDISSLSGAYCITLFICGTAANKSNTGYCYEIRFD